MNYREKRNYDNLQLRIFKGIGEYDIPQIYPEEYIGCDWISFNYAASTKDREAKGVHFFVDDYQFRRLWQDPKRYIPMLRQFKYVMSPDFSTYTDFPKAVQIYNHYRKHWLGAYMQDQGIKVISTISWSTPDSYEWCFDGEPEGATVAISSVGCMVSSESKELFVSGYKEMVKRLSPTTIIFYGTIPEECNGNIVRVKAYQEKFREAVCNGW